MDSKSLFACVGIICLTALELYALHQGLDGQYFSIVIGGICSVIGGVVGYSACKQT